MLTYERKLIFNFLVNRMKAGENTKAKAPATGSHYENSLVDCKLGEQNGVFKLMSLKESCVVKLTQARIIKK